MAEPTVITFDPDTHIYTVDNKVWPGITGVLKDVGLIDTQWYSDEAARRGTAVHEAVQLVVKGLLPPESWGGTEIEPYILAWESFVKDSKIIVHQSERLACDIDMHFCTHIDIEGEIRGKAVTIDIKSGALQAWHGIQLAGNTVLNGCRDRYVLELRSDGTYRMHSEWKQEKFASRIWDRVWAASVALYWWKKEIA